MGNSGDVLQQISMGATALANAIRQASPQQAPYQQPGYYPPQQFPSAPMPADRVGWGTLAPPGPAPTAPPATGFMAVLTSAWQGIVDFFKKLFGGGTQNAPGAPFPGGSSYPSVNNDARAQAFQMFPTGNGVALGFVPVNAQRHGNSIVVSASGFGGAKVWWQGDQMYFQEGSKQASRIDRMTSARQQNGDTRFDLTLDGGKTVSADILADGRTLRYQGYSITLG